MATTPLTPTAFRQALAQFATGITVVTAESAPGRVHGMTANSLTSVSLDPLLILICVDQKARLLPLINQKRCFGVNVLKDNQQALSEYFARGEQSAQAEASLGVHYRWTNSGIPLLEDTLVQLACHVVASYFAGDHVIFIGEVESADVHAGEPLLYVRGQYRHLAP